ncbi:alpha/beta hydrolase [Carboxydochorda subterranea]|uniref:Alpha/beta hydrolase n=1 Tax=Carboxydichorda subterranea TaxID=3109565 RepID=A0ABZ1BZA3_9FIRM|nr:alpha/beta hydrolase [Limnochorda sp. L945t]WRP18068.1 alpha/beta hydrolase [Limnochorda sp. L945t]
MRPLHRWAMAAATLAIGLAQALALAAPPAPPRQPASGPGGRDYSHARVVMSRGGVADREYWIFEPADPAPVQAPVVVFLHGWGAMLPDPYGAWIEHLVRKGNIVVFPRYQATLTTPPRSMTDHAVAAVRQALGQLSSGRHVRPDTRRFAVVGHSLGGVLAANLAVRARYGQLPLPKAVMVVEPGDPPETAIWFARKQPSIMEDYAGIDPGTLLLVVAGDADRTVGERTARTVFTLAQVAAGNKNYVIVHSDRHGRPALVADHYAPAALVPQDAPEAPEITVVPAWMQSVALRLLGLVTGRVDVTRSVGPPDALDYFGFWKLLDALLDAAFYGRCRAVALGDTPEQRFMGTWSDGVPVRPLEVYVTLPPAALPGAPSRAHAGAPEQAGAP